MTQNKLEETQIKKDLNATNGAISHRKAVLRDQRQSQKTVESDIVNSLQILRSLEKRKKSLENELIANASAPTK